MEKRFLTPMEIANTIVNVNEKIRKVFEMSGLLKIIPVIDDYKKEIAN